MPKENAEIKYLFESWKSLYVLANNSLAIKTYCTADLRVFLIGNTASSNNYQ